MNFFDINNEVQDKQYYEILDMLMDCWEYEIVEFKEARSNYDSDKI